MKNYLAIILITLALVGLTDSVVAQDHEYAVDYYYKIKWGHFNEFMDLYKKNHYPILAKMQEQGEIVRMAAVYPLNHAGESGRWDFRFTIVFKNFDAAHNSEISDQIGKELYPDQETFKQEEQLRFQLILEHLDVPLDVDDLEEW